MPQPGRQARRENQEDPEDGQGTTVNAQIIDRQTGDGWVGAYRVQQEDDFSAPGNPQLKAAVFAGDAIPQCAANGNRLPQGIQSPDIPSKIVTIKGVLPPGTQCQDASLLFQDEGPLNRHGSRMEDGVSEKQKKDTCPEDCREPEEPLNPMQGLAHDGTSFQLSRSTVW